LGTGIEKEKGKKEEQAEDEEDVEEEEEVVCPFGVHLSSERRDGLSVDGIVEEY
jgi:hypothetical protein